MIVDDLLAAQFEIPSCHSDDHRIGSPNGWFEAADVPISAAHFFHSKHITIQVQVQGDLERYQYDWCFVINGCKHGRCLMMAVYDIYSNPMVVSNVSRLAIKLHRVCD